MRSNNHKLYAAILVFTLAAGKGFAQTNAIGSELAVQLLHQFSWVPTEPRCLIQATDGNFYGLTQGGGTERKGTIFRMTTNGVFSTLVSFGSTNGSYPSGSSGSLVQGRDGNLYGTTAAGGATDLGTVFRATAAGELRTLASFNGANGNGPRILLEAADGNFFGTTDSGGTGDLGTVFRMTPEGILTTVLSFSGTNRTRPNGLIQGSDGTFYGTTQEGGSGFDGSWNSGNGIVFKMSLNGVLTTLAAFNGTNGAGPNGVIQGRDGNLYGTTAWGGVTNGVGPWGLGTVFQLTPSGSLVTLVSFNGTNGIVPQASVLQASDGNFYGSTSDNVTGISSTIFRLTPEGVLTRLHEFRSSDTLYGTTYSLVEGNDGNLYGTTRSGGDNGLGTVFRLTKDGVFTAFSFPLPDDYPPIQPSGALVLGADDAFYGTTKLGGKEDSGTIFKMTARGETTILYSLTQDDGQFPNALLKARDGNFYGTTEGATLFEFSPQGQFSIITRGLVTSGDETPRDSLVEGDAGVFYGVTSHSPNSGLSGFGGVFRFALGDGLKALVLFNGTNGSSPRGPLVIGQDGNLYGSTPRGGLGFNGDPNSGLGTLFKITAQGLLTTLFLFNGTNGARPSALVLGTDRNFYGTTGSGGLGFSGDSWSGNGTIFRLTPEGVLTTLISFNGTNGNSPQAALLQAKDGNFCGTTAYGGEGCGLGPVIGGAGYGFGTVFKLTLSGTLTTLASGNFPLIGASEGIFLFSYPSTFRSASSLVEDRNGTLYGTTGEVDRGAGVTEGAIFRLVPRPVMTVRESADGGIRLDWSSFTNATYRVEYKSTLGDLYWIPVMPAVTPSGNTSLQIDDIGGVPARFYRVRLVP